MPGASQCSRSGSRRAPEAFRRGDRDRGTPASLETALALLRPIGISENITWHHHEHSFDLERWQAEGLPILNIKPRMNRRFGDLYPRTINRMAKGTISSARLVTYKAPV